jgi:ketosteroid isomerase-like protein
MSADQPTPPGNAEVVRGIYESWSAMAGTPEQLMHPEIEWVNPDDAVEPGTRRGTVGFEQAVSRVGQAFDEIRIEVERLVEKGDRVAAVVEVDFRGRGSRVQNKMRQSHLWTVRDGKAIRFEWSNDPDRAPRALKGETRP